MKHEDEQDLKKIFHSIEIPEIDVTASVINKLEGYNMNKRTRPSGKFKVGTIVVLGTLLLTTSAIAAYQQFTITNSKGEVVYEEERFDKSRYADRTKEMQFRSLKAHGLAYELLQPGEVAAFYMAGEGDEGELYIRSGLGISFKNTNDLYKAINDSHVPVPETLLGKYHFINGAISYSADNMSDQQKFALIQELGPEARQSEEQYAFKLLDISGNTWTLHTVYSGEIGDIRVTQMRGSEKITFVWPSDESSAYSNTEEIVLNNHKVLYRAFDAEHSVRFSVSIPDSEDHIQHFISAPKKMSKEEVLSIVETYLQ
ncbi:hypothetical protein [Paenibacillus lentus]|uniref:DUF4367 domain-containing protein n=1 Tax=Paenibacillus lentus TaxID=1338368 RepID=A0A3S8RU63_9BACL|nr:hypothetical protein [Paenibacillus lentus]AZK46462.1 hypothetical protein EIM92_10005 [Paenibacillus lentus]